MSLQNVVAFWQKVQTQKDLQDRVKACVSESKSLVSVAKEAGFECTGDEFKEAEAVIGFWTAVPGSEPLRTGLKACESMEEGAAIAETIRIAGEHDYRFSREALNAVSPAIFEAQSGQLDDSALEAVAGGVSRQPFQLRSSLNTALRGGWMMSPRITGRLGPGAIAEYS